MSTLSTHVLDTASGRPAAGMPVTLERGDGDAWVRVGAGATNTDGRVEDLAPGALTPGLYRLVFDTGAYHAEAGCAGFYPQVTVAFHIAAPDEHYHVPLLLSPYGYSTYRGS